VKISYPDAEQKSRFITFSKETMLAVLDRLNPSEKCLAAESYFSKKKDKVQFSPMCLSKWQAGCTIKGTPGACGSCNIKKTVAINELLMCKHMAGASRLGIYPGLPGGMVQFIVADVDGHLPGQNARADTKNIIRIASDMSLPVTVFSSNSGNGYHAYLFFSEPTEYRKAFGIIAAMLDRCPGLTALDCVKPSKSTDGGTGGGLIALPFHQAAFDKRKSTVPVDSELNPVADDFDGCLEYFIAEYDPLSPERLDELIKEYSVDVSEKPEAAPIDPELLGKMRGQLSDCITYILTANPHTDKINFNKLVMTIVKFMIGAGFSHDEAITTCRGFLNTYPHSGTYTTPQARTDHFTALWSYLSGRNDSHFSCSFVLGMKFPGSAFDCKKCQVHEPGETSDAGAGADTVWEEPLPLNCELLPVSALNPEWLPEPLRDWVKDIAHRQQSPIDYVAIGAMVALSAILGQKLAIRPKRFDDWIVVVNLWGCVIGRPSAKKSPALQEVLKPLHRLEYAAKDSYDAEKKEWEQAQTLQELKNDNAKKNATKAVKDGKIDDAKRFLSFMGEDTQAEPLRKRYVVNDSTIEKLGELLAENPNGLLLFRDELYGFLKTINREDHANDKAFHLECWTGLGTYTYDRIGRGTIDIPNCIESILGCLTPSKIIPMVNIAVNGGIDDDGFLQRFQLMVYPDDVQFKYIDEIPDKDARDTAYEFFKYVSELSFKPGEFEKIPTRSFSKDAQKTFTAWLTALEEEICSNDIHPAIESHLAKYRSLIPSLALLIHVGSDDDLQGNIQDDSLKKAIDFGSYLKTHALRIYNLAINNSAHLGKLLLEKIKIGKLGNPFVIRDVKRAQWHGLTSDGSVETALKILVEYGYLRIKTSPTGGNQKIEYFVNPEIKI